MYRWFWKCGDYSLFAGKTLWAISRDILKGPRLFWPLNVQSAARDTSAYKNLFCTCACLLQELLCYTRMCLPTKSCFAPVHVCLQELCAAPGRVCLQDPSLCSAWGHSLLKKICWFVSVWFETGMLCFVSFVLLHVRNIQTNRSKPKNNFFAFMKQTEKLQKQIDWIE
jgi:hypothetical protein